MDLIGKKLKYMSKNAVKRLLIFLIISGIFVGALYFKYRPVYSVELSGNDIGLVHDKTQIDGEIDEQTKPAGPVISAVLKEVPTYDLKLADKNLITTNEDQVLEKISEKIDKTYKIYEIKVKDKTVTKVATKEEAEKLKEELKKERGYTDVAISDLITKELSVSEYSQAKKVALEEVAVRQKEERRIAEEKRKKAEEERKRLASIAAKKQRVSRGGISRGGSISGTSSPYAYSKLSSVSFSRPAPALSRISVGWMGYRGHTGVDFPGPRGTSVTASTGGVVIKAKHMNYSYGNHIIVDHGNGISTLYAHLSSINVRVGQSVSKGQTIGRVGSTGNSTGSHLHFEIRINNRPVNPAPYI